MCKQIQVPMNPCNFSQGELIKSVYTGKLYTVIEPDKNGMAKLKNEYGEIETWNACNNPHFKKANA